MTTVATAAPFAPYGPPRAAEPDADGARASRLETVDLVRGLVMVIMLLDHTRDFVHTGGFLADPTDLATTSVALFLTRWVTHFCAPAFVLLAGAGAYLQRLRGRPARELSHFLWTRGLWLVLLELTVVRLLAFSGLGLMAPFALGVIWALGVSMVCLAALVRLPTWVAGTVGVVMIAAHNLLDGRVAAAWTGPASAVPSAADKLFTLLHQQGAFPVAGWPSPVAFVVYPLVPWVGVMAAGYAFGAVYGLDRARRRRLLLALGGALAAAFVVLRATRGYGDPAAWQPAQVRGGVYGVLSFVNTQKYPPSLLYLLMTLGPTVLLLGALEGPGRRTRSAGDAGGRGRVARWLITFGRVPLFFYVLQWAAAHGLAVALGLLAGQSVAHLFMNMAEVFAAPPRGVGFGLPVVYAAWAAGLVLLYPACRWFAGVKARRRDIRWLSYL